MDGVRGVVARGRDAHMRVGTHVHIHTHTHRVHRLEKSSETSKHQGGAQTSPEIERRPPAGRVRSEVVQPS